MFYICYKPSNKWSHIEVGEVNTEKEALKFIEDKHLPQTRILGVFEGKRLNFTIGEKRVVKKTIVGFTEFKEENDHSITS